MVLPNTTTYKRRAPPWLPDHTCSIADSAVPVTRAAASRKTKNLPADLEGVLLNAIPVPPAGYLVTRSAAFVCSFRTWKKTALTMAMQTSTAPKVQTMVAPVGVSKNTEQ